MPCKDGFRLDESRQLPERLQPDPLSEDRELPTLLVGERESSSSCNPLIGLELFAEKRDALGLPVVDPASDRRNKKVQRRKDVVHPAILLGTSR